MGVLPINREGGSILSFDWLEGCFSVAMIVFGMVVKDLPGFSMLSSFSWFSSVLFLFCFSIVLNLNITITLHDVRLRK